MRSCRDGHEVRIFHPAVWISWRQTASGFEHGRASLTSLAESRDRALHLHHAKSTAPAQYCSSIRSFASAAEPYTRPVDPLPFGSRFALCPRGTTLRPSLGVQCHSPERLADGLVPVYSTRRRHTAFATVFSIHNLAYQGNYSPSDSEPRIGSSALVSFRIRERHRVFRQRVIHERRDRTGRSHHDGFADLRR